MISGAIPWYLNCIVQGATKDEDNGMGAQDVHRDDNDAAQLRLFISHLLRDVGALEHMLAVGMIESGVHRIGAEQEIFLVNAAWRPALLTLEILERVEDPYDTTELSLFNLEINLDPLGFTTTDLFTVHPKVWSQSKQRRTSRKPCVFFRSPRSSLTRLEFLSGAG
jgi:hypothetical protein